MKTGRVVTLVSGALVAGLALGGIGLAYAEPTTDSTEETTLAGHFGSAMHRAGGGLAALVADLTGLEIDEIHDRRVDGESLAEIASSEGVETDTVLDAALEDAEARITERLNSTELPQRGQRGQMRGISAEALEDATGLEMSEIMERRADGESFADILTDAGADPDAVLADLLEDLSARVDEAVESGNLDQERADEMLENSSERLKEMMYSTDELPARGERGGRGPGHGGGNGTAPGGSASDAGDAI